MTRLAIIVEGPTEIEFVNKVLSPYLSERGVYPYPNSLDGDVRVPRLASRMAQLLHSHDRATSLVDFYGFTRPNAASPDELQNRIDDAVHRQMGPNRDSAHAFSYVQQYEFEALLFSNVDAFAILPGVSEAQVTELRAIRSQFLTPEHINAHLAPSKRIASVIRPYGKREYGKREGGYIVAQEIGLDAIRAACPRFGAWLTRLESLAGSGQ